MVVGWWGRFKNTRSKNFEVLFLVEKEEKSFQATTEDRWAEKKRSKVSGELCRERKSGGKESENLSVKSLHTLTHSLPFTFTHSHARLNTLTCTHSFSKRLQPVVFVLLCWLLYHVHLNADWSASLSFRQRHKRWHTQWGLFSAEWGCLGVGKHLQNRHSTSTLRVQWGAKPWWIIRDYS